MYKSVIYDYKNSLSILTTLSVVSSFGISSFLIGTSVVEDDSEGGTGIRSEFSHLLLEVSLVVSWETLNGLGDGGHFTHEDEHVLGQVLGDGSNGAEFFVLIALLHDVEDGFLEVAGAQVLHDLSTLGEEVEVLGEISAGDDRHWISNDRMESDQVVDGLLVEAVRGFFIEVSGLIEGFVVTFIESLNSIDVPEGISHLFLIGLGSTVEKSLDFWNLSVGIGDSEHGSESEGGVRFHLSKLLKLIIKYLFSYIFYLSK